MNDKIIELRRIIISLLLALTPILAIAEQWRLHATFDGNVARVIDTPDYTYFLSYCQKHMPVVSSNANSYLSLFRYDKDGEEIQTLDKQHMLSETVLYTAEYNPDKGYLLVAYVNGNIDLIHNNGDVTNIPGLKQASDDYSKVVKSVTFDPAHNEIYLTTEFGYVVVDDVSGEVRRSRFYEKPINTVARFGEDVLIGCDDGLYATSVVSHDNFPDFRKLENFSNVRQLLQFGERLFVLNGEGYGAQLPYLTFSDGDFRYNPWLVTNMIRIDRCRNGMMILGPENIWIADKDLNLKDHRLDPADVFRTVSGWNGSDFWFDYGRKGLTLKKAVADDAGNISWTVSAEGLKPNAANAFRSDNMVYHRDYGLLVRNHGITPVFSVYDEQTPDLICSYRNLGWTPRSATYLAPSDAFVQWNPGGMAVDPANSNHIYSGSVFHGLMRLDLSDPSKSLRLGKKSDPGNGKPGFVGFQDDFSSWDALCFLSVPMFDSYGNLWTSWYSQDRIAQNDALELWYWSPEDRAASKDAATLRMPLRIPVSGTSVSTSQKIVPLCSQSSRNILMFLPGGWGGLPTFIDHKGTISNTGDDERVDITSLTDQDGTKIDFAYLISSFEDISTGTVWIGYDSGVFNFKPSEIMKTGGRVNRIKVSRNDGTNLADYLLDGVQVNSIMADNSGRKWFATNGGGIVVTSADGTQVLKTYTVENSDLPDNEVFQICYNPENNSMMVSTSIGLAELFLSTSASADGKSDVKAYPNPVRPDYFGYVTIEGLADNALVKVVDASGNLVKEIGFAAGGEARWDVTNMNSKRVPGGVYYILASGAPDGDGFSSVGKVLVVN